MLSTHAGNILITDDSLLCEEKLRDILIDAGYRVQCAYDGAGVIEALKRDHADIDLLIIDLEMPNVDGFRVLDWINQNDMRGAFPVLFIAGESDAEDVKPRALDELGVEGILTRDVTPGEAVFLVSRFLYGPGNVEKREDRVCLNAPAIFTVGDHTYDGTLMNISSGGIYLVTPEPLVMGSNFPVAFTLLYGEAEAAGTDLIARCEVKWGSGVSGAGLSFTSIGRREMQYIGDYLAARAAASMDHHDVH